VVVTVLIVGAGNPIVVVAVDDGIENVGTLDVVVIIGNDVVVIGWARRLESALFADEVVVAVVVVTGRKLVVVGANVAVVVVFAPGVGNEKGALVVAVVVVVDGVENEKEGAAVVEIPVAVVVVAGVDNENDGID